jgi:hypothetical protein
VAYIFGAEISLMPEKKKLTQIRTRMPKAVDQNQKKIFRKRR